MDCLYLRKKSDSQIRGLLGKLEELKDITPSMGSSCLIVSRPRQGSLQSTYNRMEHHLDSVGIRYSYFDEVVTEYVERRNTMVDGLNAIEGVFCPKPSGAFYCVAKFPVDSTEKFCQWLLESFDHEGETVMTELFFSTQKFNSLKVKTEYRDANLDKVEIHEIKSN